MRADWNLYKWLLLCPAADCANSVSPLKRRNRKRRLGFPRSFLPVLKSREISSGVKVRSLSMTQRLHRFVDNRVVGDGLVVDIAAEIATQNLFCEALLCVFALVQFVLFYGTFFEDKDYRGRIHRKVARWFFLWVYRLSDIVSCLGLLLGALVGFVLRRPYLAYTKHFFSVLSLSLSLSDTHTHTHT